MNTNKKEKFINKNNAVHKRFWQIGIRTFFVFLFVIAKEPSFRRQGALRLSEYSTPHKSVSSWKSGIFLK